MKNIISLGIFLLLLPIAVLAQTQITTYCPDKCENSTLYLKGIWDSKLKICKYGYTETCKYGCETDFSISKAPSCKEFPDTPPANATDYDETIWNMVKKLWDREKIKSSASIQFFGTEYKIGDFGKLWLQLINSTGQEVDNAVCLLDVYDPDGIKYIDSATMCHLEKGIYYYDFIVPIYTGVYPAIAKCYYAVSQQTETADSGTIWIGTNNANSYTATQALDAVYWKIDEALSGGKYRIDYVLNFTGITSPSLVNSVTIDWWGKWNGQINDNLIFYIWNFTSNSWVQLPNQVANTGGSRIEVTNTITTSNLTQSGLLDNGQMAVRINDANATDATKSRAENDYLAIKINYFSSPEWQEVKGASEAHVSGDGSNLVYMSTNCGDATSNCGVFTNDNEFGMREGEVEDNITVYSLTNKGDVDTEWAYTTPFSVDCSALYWIKFWNGTGWEDITDNVSLSSEVEKENCVIKVPITLNPNGITQSEYYYRIKYDNYMKWEVDWSKDLLDSLNSTLWADCENYGQAYNYTYEVPITESTNLSSISTLLSCHRILDDLYWFYRFYNDSTGISTTGEYLSYLYEARFYRQEILRNLGIPNYFINKGIYNLASAINSTQYYTLTLLGELNQSVFNLSQAQYNYFQQIIALLNSINYTLNTTLEYKLDLINGTAMQINQTTFDTLQYLAGMNNSIAQYLMVINGSTYNITYDEYQHYLSLLEAINSVNFTANTTITSKLDFLYNSLFPLLHEINATGNTTLELVASINQTLWDDIFVILKDINFTTNTTLEYKLDLINYTTWQSWIMLQNLTIGNVSVTANVNWTEGVPIIWNATGKDQINYNLLSLSQNGIQMVVETLTCIDNTTLVHQMNITNCIFDTCVNTARNLTETCVYGCTNNMCLPPTYFQYGLAIPIILILAGFIYLAWRTLRH